MDADRWYDLTADNRRQAADLFEDLTDEQWRTPSLCGSWTVRDVAAHLVVPFAVPPPRFLLALLRERGSFDRANDRAARAVARRPTAELVGLLRANADRRFSPPGVGPGGQLTDTCVHLRDVARPLGLETSPPASTWAEVLAFLTSPRARIGFVPRGRLAGLTLTATDSGFAHGTGETVSGTGEALALAVTGRRVALEDLTGDGVEQLRRRLR